MIRYVVVSRFANYQAPNNINLQRLCFGVYCQCLGQASVIATSFLASFFLGSGWFSAAGNNVQTSGLFGNVINLLKLHECIHASLLRSRQRAGKMLTRRKRSQTMPLGEGIRTTLAVVDEFIASRTHRHDKNTLMAHDNLWKNKAWKPAASSTTTTTPTKHQVS